ncbi:hypothetical protein PTTG_29527 [Puccinia triticina 1-1 BBBD Race 1]|uniref:Uncharacterized protein n=1 Tax=Puccinia triticina (isolate 1-1 / race 1 (BBBD)) TaxID=630390 RepID=A0A180G5R6_PUCT1|nr:hypothetical protein PTTG_29527 [Puccinia triticina 1-1 BBBD Race 1]
MSNIRTPNHPAAFTGHFIPVEDSSVDSVRANQYRYVKTPSYFQCGGIHTNKKENFEVQLLTNTALNNTLTANSIYSISGKLIALNNGSTPVLSYAHETVTRIGEAGPEQPDFNNKTNVTGLGMVVERREVVSESNDARVFLEVTVAHCDWDGENRCHRRFNIKYVVPGTKNLIKTHSLYQVGREVCIIGRLVDFEMETHTAVVLVSSVSVTNGHQVGRSVSHTPTNLGSGSGIQLTKFTPSPTKQSLPPQPIATTSRASYKQSPTGKGDRLAESSPANATAATRKATKIDDEEQLGEPGSPISSRRFGSDHKKPNAEGSAIKSTISSKGKAVNRKTPEDSDKEDHSSNDDATEDEEDTDGEEQITPPTKAKQGRPRKNFLKEAAKRMKKF